MHEPVIRGIPELVAWRFRVTPAALMSRRRDRAFVRPRQVAMWLATRVAHAPQADVGRYFGRDHTTVMHAVKRVDRLMASDATFAENVRFTESVWELAKRLDPDEAAALRSMMIRRVA